LYFFIKLWAFLHIWGLAGILKIVLIFILVCYGMRYRRQLTLGFLLNNLWGFSSLFWKTFLESILSYMLNQAVLYFKTIASFFWTYSIFWINFFFVFYQAFFSAFLLKHFYHWIDFSWIVIKFSQWFLLNLFNIRFAYSNFILVL